jgi:hypothetical protein
VSGAEGAAIVRDIGYAGYEGPRHVEQAPRVLAVHTARSLLSRSGTRRALLVAWLPALVCAVQVYIENKGTGTMAGARLPLSLLTKGWGVLFPSLVVALIAAGATVAEDRRSHALSFYFARPLSPDAYLVGRLLGVLGVISVGALGPPLALSLFRVALAGSAADLGNALVVVAVVAVLGAVFATALSVFALLGGALTESRGAAQGLVACAFALPWMCAGLGDKLLDGPWLTLLSLPNLMSAIGHATIRESASLFSALWNAMDDGGKEAPLWAAVPALGAIVALPLWLLRHRVAQLGAAGGEGGGE